MKKIYFAISLAAALTGAAAAEESPAQNITMRDQPSSIAGILKNETSSQRIKELAAIIDSADEIYASPYDSCRKGKKIVIFIDPAHGMVQNGADREWQGALTWRKSTTGVPEELYSIPICRKFYRLLSENPNFEIASTPDFME
ncbi:MAG: hypothetical protein ACRCUT_07950, partial [Spirochaetota bacterium]